MSDAKCYWSDDHIQLKPFVRSEKSSARFVTVDKLSDEKKQLLWSAIKQQDPAMAKLMADKQFLEFKEFFNAKQKIDQKTFNKLTGKKRVIAS